MITSQGFAKGDVFGAARIAGVLAAKRTGDLIPLCHPLPLSWAGVELLPVFPQNNYSQASIIIVGEASLAGQTGIEMEALAAVTIAGLTVYDMCKAVDKAMSLTDVSLLEKKGGRSGHYLSHERAALLQNVSACELNIDDVVAWTRTAEHRLEFSRSDNSGTWLGGLDVASGWQDNHDFLKTGVVVLGESLLRPCRGEKGATNSGLLQVVKPGDLSKNSIFAVLGS
jgi:cyclic pyranopterin phosphate synthase